MSRAMRDIPWQRIVKFHQEICRRTEETFFSLPAGDANSERWSSLVDFEPSNLAGFWEFPANCVASQQLFNRLRANQAQEIFLGGPCWFAWKKEGVNWYIEWRPAIYREVHVVIEDDVIRLMPLAGNWDVSPLVFELLDKRQETATSPLTDAMAAILQNVQTLQTQDGRPASQSVRETLAAYSNALGEELRKAAFDFPGDKVRAIPTPWVLFAPSRGGGSAYTKYILKDYTRLESLLAEIPQEVGGFGLLPDDHDVSQVTAAEILPIVSLNDSQLKAVEAVFKAKPVTVISGPPGCGKSQVVLSILLNAWSQGISTLFASNNNQAVDVVRQRLEAFQNQIPIAIRAGARRFSNIEDSLRRSLNLIAAMATTIQPGDLERLQQKRIDLTKRRDAKRAFLSSELPDQVDQAVGAAITAYGNYKQLMADDDALRHELTQELAALGYPLNPENFQDSIYIPLEKWMTELDQLKMLVETEERARTELSAKIVAHRNTRNAACVTAGMNPDVINNWRWLSTSDGALKAFDAWWNALKSFIFGPIDVSLAAIEWQKTFETWSGALDAHNWREMAEKLMHDIRESEQKLSADIERIVAVDSQFAAASQALQNACNADSLPDGEESVSGWLTAYAQYCSIPTGHFDWLPWSEKSKIHKIMSHHEVILKSVMPLSVWKRIGPIDQTSRNVLSETLETSRRWYAAKAQVVSARAERQIVAGVTEDFKKRARLCRFKLDQLPGTLAIDKWIRVSDVIERQIEIAKVAESAWTRRDERGQLVVRIRALRQEFLSIAAGSPLKEAWLKGNGAAFAQDLAQFSENPSMATLASLRASAYEEQLRQLIELWQQAIENEKVAMATEIDVANLPTRIKRIQAWYREQPSKIIIKLENENDFPSCDSILFDHKIQCRNWINKWNIYCKESRENLIKKAKQEYSHGVNILREGYNSIPGQSRPLDLTRYIYGLSENKYEDWDLKKIRTGFEKFQPGIIRSDIEGIEAELQTVSFDAAKIEWQRRVADDPELQDAIRDLRTHYQRNQGEVGNNGAKLFEIVLRAQPIWISTALAGYAIPLKAKGSYWVLRACFRLKQVFNEST